MASGVAQNDVDTLFKGTRGRTKGTPVSYRYDPANVIAGITLTPSPDTDIRAGEIVAWSNTTSAPCVVRAVRSGFGGKYIGIARDSGRAKLGIYPTEIGVYTSGVHMLRTTAGETYVHGQRVFQGFNTADGGADRITNTNDPNVTVGLVYLPDGSTVSGDLSPRVPIIIDQYTNYSGK